MTSLEQWSALISIGYAPADAAVLVNEGSALFYIRAWRVLSRSPHYAAAVRAARERLARRG